MRSLFHFPFPCTQPPSQQPSPTATVPLQPEMSHRPHPAPVRHRRRSPALLSAVRPLPALIAPHHLSTAPLLPAPIGLASSTSRPPRAAARVPLSRCVGPGPLAGKNRTACIPFSPNALKRPSSWQHPLEMHAFRDQDGNILAPCDSGMRHAAWPNGLCALRRGPGLLAACAPLSSRPRSSPPSYTRRASPPASRPRTPPSAAPPIAVGMSCRSGSSCRPRAAHADASCPSMRARRHRLGPDPRQPSPSPEPTGPQPRANRTPAPRQPSPGPPVEPSAPTRAPPPAAPRPAARVPLRFW